MFVLDELKGTAEVYLTFRRSELFYYFAFVLRSAGILLMAPGAIHSLLAFFLGLFCPPRITYSST